MTGGVRNSVTGGVHGNAQVVQGHDVHVEQPSYGGDHVDNRGVQADTFVGTVHQHGPHEVDWPIRVGTLPEQAPHFRPRAVTEQLAETLGESGTVVLRQVLSGTGGVGKTQLAKHYARTLAQVTDPEHRVDVLVWTDASSRERITSAYAQAARHLHPTVPDDPEQAASLFLAWLGDPSKHGGRRWLIVWDDLTDPADVRDLWPPHDEPNGRAWSQRGGITPCRSRGDN